MARGPKNRIEVCDLTDWHTPETSGRGRKAKGLQKWTVEIDKRNWSLNIVREGYPSVGEKFSGNLACFFGNMMVKVGISSFDVADKVNEGLATLLGRKMEIDRSLGIDAIGRAMDEFYKCSLLSDDIDPIIAEKLNLSKDNEEADVEEEIVEV